MAFIVVFDNNDGICVPMGWDEDCDGAIEGAWTKPVAMFETRADARKAINISAAAAKLAIAQGKPANDDFTTGRKHLKIVPLKAR